MANIHRVPLPTLSFGPPKGTNSHQERKAAVFSILHPLLYYSPQQCLPLLLRPHGRKHGFCLAAHIFIEEQTLLLFSPEGSDIEGNNSIFYVLWHVPPYIRRIGLFDS